MKPIRHRQEQLLIISQGSPLRNVANNANWILFEKYVKEVEQLQAIYLIKEKLIFEKQAWTLLQKMLQRCNCNNVWTGKKSKKSLLVPVLKVATGRYRRKVTSSIVNKMLRGTSSGLISAVGFMRSMHWLLLIVSLPQLFMSIL